MSPDELAADFLRHVCQTSPTPLGLVVTRARGASLWDAGGREYSPAVGMGLRTCYTGTLVIARGRKAAALPARHGYCELGAGSVGRLARRLPSWRPASSGHLFHTLSGAEASRVALKLARKSRQAPFVAFSGGLPRRTSRIVGLRPRGYARLLPLLPDVDSLPFGAAAALGASTRASGRLVDPSRAKAGNADPARDFFPPAQALRLATGALLICDEVMNARQPPRLVRLPALGRRARRARARPGARRRPAARRLRVAT